MSEVVWSKNAEHATQNTMITKTSTRAKALPPGFTHIFLAWEKVRPVCTVRLFRIVWFVYSHLPFHHAQHANPLSRIMIIFKPQPHNVFALYSLLFHVQLCYAQDPQDVCLNGLNILPNFWNVYRDGFYTLRTVTQFYMVCLSSHVTFQGLVNNEDSRNNDSLLEPHWLFYV